MQTNAGKSTFTVPFNWRIISERGRAATLGFENDDDDNLHNYDPVVQVSPEITVIASSGSGSKGKSYCTKAASTSGGILVGHDSDQRQDD